MFKVEVDLKLSFVFGVWLLIIGQLVMCVGVVMSVLCFYEVEGLFLGSCSVGGYCQYLCYVLWCVVFICVVQVVGLILLQIRVVLVMLFDGCMLIKVDWVWLLVSWVLLLDVCIVVLQQLCVWLIGCIGCGCLLLKVCVFYNFQDQVVVQGLGLRFLCIEMVF